MATTVPASDPYREMRYDSVSSGTPRRAAAPCSCNDWRPSAPHSFSERVGERREPLPKACTTSSTLSHAMRREVVSLPPRTHPTPDGGGETLWRRGGGAGGSPRAAGAGGPPPAPPPP